MISVNHDTREYYVDVKGNHITIGNNRWIGANAVILSEKILRDNTLVGARCTVTKSFSQSNYIIAGNPAKFIRDINYKIVHIHTCNLFLCFYNTNTLELC